MRKSLLACLLAIVSATDQASAIERKVLIIGIDGCRADCLQLANTPNVDQLVANGAVSWECMAEDITISGPCWSSIVCGVHRNKHGVTGNSFVGSNYAQYPHFFKRLAESCDIQTASICNWTPVNTQILLGNADLIESGGPDSLVTTRVGAALQDPDIDVIFVHLDEVDGAGHANGFDPTVPAYLAEIQEKDTQIGQMLAAMQARPTFANEDWLIILTSDHGGTIDGSHGRNIPEHRLTPLIVSGASTLSGTLIAGTPELVDIPATVFTFLGLPISGAWGWDGVARGLDMANATSEPFACVPPPPIPMGACCAKTGVCSLTIQSDCTNARGMWQGVDTVCVPNPCLIHATLFAENFNGVVLGDTVNETPAATSVWSPTPPAGWTVDRTGVPANGGTEFRGWTFVSPTWWASTAGDQGRSQFTKASGVIAVADPDEWDDFAHAAGTYNTTLRSPIISLAGITPGSAKLVMDSSWLPEDNQRVRLSASFNGAPSVTVFDWTSSGPNFKPDAPNESLVIPLNAPANATNVALTFSMFDAGNDWWWAIDNLEVIGVSTAQRRLLLFEDFEAVPLGSSVDETPLQDRVWSGMPPAGWTFDDSGVFGIGTPGLGVTEWKGWAIASKAWWASVAGDQGRSQFTLASGAVAVADPDEWNDIGSPATQGTYNARMITKTVSVVGLRTGTMQLEFDSSWLPEEQQRATLSVSFDGAPAQTLLQWDSVAGPTFKPNAPNEHVTLSINNPGGASTAVLTFSVLNARNNWWWAVDNISLTAAPTCLGDVNGDGSVSPADLFTYLDLWFATVGTSGVGLLADSDRDGTVGVNDLFFFLDEWFASSGVNCP